MIITNIVASGDLHQSIDLDTLRSLGPIYTYNTEIYHGGYILLTHCKATVYRSGKYIFTGLKNPDNLETAWKEFTSVLAPFVDISLAAPPAIRNIVILENYGEKINLTRICNSASLENMEYEPEQFPGLIYRMKKGTALLFSSGKIVIVGVRSMKEAEESYADLKSILDTM
ncbi:hypothetical protein [Methanospirillum sp.]|jgi:transcription initiation factor TFIID TATA-box-binding protein|uniref:hypothetical protein n=1 Tax=Methanospirillum sp. TaxID=45200 RepID=UPI001BD5EE89|nr:hypothetical protein [Methanospirillum sp.]